MNAAARTKKKAPVAQKKLALFLSDDDDDELLDEIEDEVEEIVDEGEGESTAAVALALGADVPEENGRGTGMAGEDRDAAEMTVTSTCAPQLALSYVGMRCRRPRRSGRQRWSKLMMIQTMTLCSRVLVPGNGARSDR